jgi:hypothetical protein
MRFSWTGLILAPLLVPVMFSVIGAAMLSSPQEGGNPVLGFLVLLIPGCIVSYGATIFLFLPYLFLLSLWSPVTAFRACLVLGALLFVPLMGQDRRPFQRSGP